MFQYLHTPLKLTVERAVPSWFAIGWNGQNQSLFLTPEESRQHAILADFVSEAYYGQWYVSSALRLTKPSPAADSLDPAGTTTPA